MDSGLDLSDPRFTPYLCKKGHRNFTKEPMNDFIGHGTHTFGIITSNTTKKNYCIVVLKVFGRTGFNSYQSESLALDYIKSIAPDFVNYSGGGSSPMEKERQTIESLKNTKFIVAAGNNGENIGDGTHFYYPASFHYSNVIAVGNLETPMTRSKSSNYGKFDMVWENGTNIVSTVPYSVSVTGYATMSGTSMASPRHLARLLND